MFRLGLYAFILLLLNPLSVWAQHYSLLNDEQAMEQVKQVMHYTYSAHHHQAEKELEVLKRRVLAAHPVHPLLQALNLYWRDAPMHIASPYFPEFIQLLHKTNKLAEAYLDQDKDKVVSTFCTLTAHSLLARYHAEKGDNMAAIKEARPTYAYMKEGFVLKDEYNEFYFSTGLYNYYRVKYPELHPVYKPFMWFFEDGDKTLGLQQLEYASANTVFTKVEAATFLVHLYLYYENLPRKALQIVRGLYKQYPENRFLRLLLTESLVSAGQWAEAVPHAAYLRTHSDAYYRAAGELFSGIIQEKEHQNYSKAYSHYQAALNLAEPLNYIANTYRSMANAGLARYYEAQQQQAKAKAHWQQALKLAQYEYPVKQEAKKHLR